MTEDLALAVARAVDTVRDGIGEAVWVPLEAMLPADWCSGFMFMGASDAYVMPDGLVTCPTDQPPRERRDWRGDPWPRRTVFLYKHGITRRYLNIGEDLRCYSYRADLCPVGEPVYMPIRTETAITVAFDGIEELGAERTTRYDASFVAARNARLVAAGFRVIS